MVKKKPIKAVLGILAANKLLKNSQGARDIAGNLGIAPRLLADKYEDEEKKKQLRANQQVAEPAEMMNGGPANVMRGTGAAIKGTKFQGVF
jgi:hypothetical protein